MKQTITPTNGNFLSYAEYGDRNGFPLLVQHGLISSIDDHDLFDRLIKLNVRLICVARPGYGESSPYLMDSYAEWANLISPLIEKLDLAQFDVLGMSSGAPYGYAIGHRFPGKVRNIYIFSGIPALYDELVLSDWPYKPAQDQSIASLERLAYDLFFSNLTTEDRIRNDIRDSMMNNCFGVAQDLRLRFRDWGFRLTDVKANVFMRHSKCDDAVPFSTVVRTSELFPNCKLELTDTGPHFSNEALDDFIKTTIVDKMPAKPNSKNHVHEIAAATLRHGGVAFELDSCSFLPAMDIWSFPKYPGRTAILPPDTELIEALTNYISANEQYLREADCWLGTWIHPQTRNFYLDIATGCEDLDTAKKLALEASQRDGRRIVAIYNSKRKETVYL
jgi:pimeloyl-ACP methyl ester carboxylesterase